MSWPISGLEEDELDNRRMSWPISGLEEDELANQLSTCVNIFYDQYIGGEVLWVTPIAFQHIKAAYHF
jgi:hypothetical protein